MANLKFTLEAFATSSLWSFTSFSSALYVPFWKKRSISGIKQVRPHKKYIKNNIAI